MITNKGDSFAKHTPAETKSAKKLGRNTWRYVRADGAECVRLHKTDVACTLKGQTTLNSGGWRTVTTKDRMNSNRAGWRVFSLNGRWYVSGGPDGERVEFFDGITLPRDLKRKGKAKPVTAETATLKQLDKYLAALKRLEKLPEPTGGDCWLCSMFGGTLTPGAKVHDPQHLRDHLAERYIFGALIVIAMRWAGRTDHAISYYWREFPKKNSTGRAAIIRDVRKFFKAQLGIGAL